MSRQIVPMLLITMVLWTCAVGFRLVHKKSPRAAVSGFRTVHIELDSASSRSITTTRTTWFPRPTKKAMRNMMIGLCTILASGWIDAITNNNNNNLNSNPTVSSTTIVATTTTTTTTTTTIPPTSDAVLQNRMLHYGVYCGPGPADPWGLAPVDDVDRVCQTHDQQYRMCLEDVNNNQQGLSSSSSSKFALPTSMSQIVAVRGWLPKPLSHMLYQAFPQYVECIHHADEQFVQGLQQVEKEGLVPTWWTHTETAPANAEGARGYQEACVIGVPDILTNGPSYRGNILSEGLGFMKEVGGHWWTIPPARADEGCLQQLPQPSISSMVATDHQPGNGGGLCLLSSRRVFLGGALDLFSSDLAADAEENRPLPSLLTSPIEKFRGLWSVEPAEASSFSLPALWPSPLLEEKLEEKNTFSTLGEDTMDPFLFMRPFSAHINGVLLPTSSRNQRPPISTILFFRD